MDKQEWMEDNDRWFYPECNKDCILYDIFRVVWDHAILSSIPLLYIEHLNSGDSTGMVKIG